ncbi:hypothetical protein JCM14036_22450 [Desulfotomaculum defluvii]
MSNQFIILLLLVVPWLTLLLMKKEDLKRFMPAALFTAFTSGIIYELGVMAEFWYFREVAFPLIMFGLLPVAAIWVLSFTYGQFWRYAITNAILDLGFAFVLFTWFGWRELIGVGPWTRIIVYIINFLHSILIYGYQIWQERRIRV